MYYYWQSIGFLAVDWNDPEARREQALTTPSPWPAQGSPKWKKQRDAFLQEEAVFLCGVKARSTQRPRAQDVWEQKELARER
jgi:hypothetical protein